MTDIKITYEGFVGEMQVDTYKYPSHAVDVELGGVLVVRDSEKSILKAYSLNVWKTLTVD